MGTDFTVQLTDDQIEQFRERGHLVIDRITTDEEVEWLRGVYDDLFGNRVGEDAGTYFDLAGKRGHDGEDVLPQILNPETKVPELLETTFRRNALQLGAQLLGVAREQLGAFGHMILKPAKYGRETPWHQDEAYWDPTADHRGVSVWMPLEDATIESGCMQFVPGTHKYPVREHKHIDDDPLVHGLMLKQYDETPEGAVAAPVPAGGASFHHCRILHYAGPNTTDRARRAYIQVCSAPSTPREKPHDRPWQREAREAIAQAGVASPYDEK